MNTAAARNKPQLDRLYAAAPILFWPWIWYQLWHIDRWMKSVDLQGDEGRLLIEIGPGWTLYVAHMSDNVSGYKASPKFSYEGHVTFASLCETPCDAGTPFAAIKAPENAIDSCGEPTIHRTNEYAEALRPVP